MLKWRLRNASLKIHVLARSTAVDETTSVVVLASMSLVHIQANVRQENIAVTANVLYIAPHVLPIATACRKKRVVVLRMSEKT